MSATKIIKPGGDKLDKFEESVSQVSFITYAEFSHTYHRSLLLLKKDSLEVVKSVVLYTGFK